MTFKCFPSSSTVYNPPPRLRIIQSFSCSSVVTLGFSHVELGLRSDNSSLGLLTAFFICLIYLSASLPEIFAVLSEAEYN